VPPGTYGDSGRNILTELGESSADFTALKGFRFEERYNPRFRAEFFNLFNIWHFGFANATGAASLADNHGTPSAFGQIRIVGLAGKI
jgi:hypothetical protein